MKSLQTHTTKRSYLGAFSAGQLEALKTNLAGRLNRSTRHLQPATWKLLLLLFCVLFPALFSLSLFSGFRKPELPLKMLTGPPVVPASIGKNTSAKSKAAYSPSPLLQFRSYLDSLAATAAGRAELENLEQYHPGLLDSFRQVENSLNSSFVHLQ